MKHARSYFQSVLSAADFPGEILTGVPVVEIKGSAETVVIHHRGVVRYDEAEIDVASAIGPVRIVGEGLNIIRMNRERIVLRGCVHAVFIGEKAPC